MEYSFLAHSNACTIPGVFRLLSGWFLPQVTFATQKVIGRACWKCKLSGIKQTHWKSNCIKQDPQWFTEPQSLRCTDQNVSAWQFQYHCVWEIFQWHIALKHVHKIYIPRLCWNHAVLCIVTGRCVLALCSPGASTLHIRKRFLPFQAQYYSACALTLQLFSQFTYCA